MELSEIQILPIKPREGLVAIGSVVVDGRLYLGSLGIYARRDGEGYRMTYPTKVIGGRSLNIYHPITREAAKRIEAAVLDKAEEVLGSADERSNDHYARHHHPHAP